MTNFHQTPLDTFPFTSALKKVQSKQKSYLIKTTQKEFQKDFKEGQQTVSYWAGLRITGPIRPHEIRESDAAKLQDKWY